MRFQIFAPILFFLSCTNVAFANMQQMSKTTNPFDRAFLGNVTYLFDQSSLIEGPEFQKSTEQEKQIMLYELFNARKNEYYWEMLRSRAGYYLAFLGAGLGYRFVYPRFFPKNAIAVAAPPVQNAAAPGYALIYATLLQPVLWGLFAPATREIERVYDIATRILSSFTSENGPDRQFNDELDKLEHAYIIRKRNISAALWPSAETALQKARSIEGGVGFGRDGVEVKTFLKAVMAIPNQVKPLNFNAAKIKEAFRGLKLSSPEAISEFCYRFVSASEQDSPVSKIPLLFYGKSGVGKTETARRIADVLDTMIEIIPLEEVNHITDLTGSGGEQGRPGLIAEAMMRANKNGNGSKALILLFDESDRMVNRNKYGNSNELVPSLLKLIDPNTGSYYNKYFDADIDISYLGLIFIANSKFKDPALRNRLQGVEFEGFELEYKVSYVRDVYLEGLFKNEFSHPQRGVSKEELSEADWKKIDDMTREDQDPGFRTIFLNVRRYLEHKALIKLFGEEASTFRILPYDEQDNFDSESDKGP